MAAKKDETTEPAEGLVARDDLDNIDVATPAAQVKLVVGQKVTFATPATNDVSLGTIAGFQADGTPLVQWNGQQQPVAISALTVQP